MFNVLKSLDEAQKRRTILGLLDDTREMGKVPPNIIETLTQMRLDLIKLGATEEELEQIDEVIQLADKKLDAPKEPEDMQVLRSFLED